MKKMDKKNRIRSKYNLLTVVDFLSPKGSCLFSLDNHSGLQLSGKIIFKKIYNK